MKNKPSVTKRINELYRAIVTGKKSQIRRIITYPDKTIPKYYYVVTINKNEQQFTQRVDEFNKILSDNLKSGERLFYDNDSFCIVSDDCEISYILEGYSKQANMKGYIDNGVASQKLLYRMGFNAAIRYARKYNVYDCAMSKMDNAGWIEKYPDPADRLVALFKHERGK